MGQRCRRIVVLIYDGFQALDAVGPLEVFFTANRVAQARCIAAPAYRIELLGVEAGAVATASGYALVAARDYRALRRAPDTLIVAGGEGSRTVRHDARLLAWLRRMASRVRRLCSVCTGSLVLAEAGLLDGRRATTHWRACAELSARHPAVTVLPDPIFVRDGDIFTSAGVTAGIDLALYLVEQDLGPVIARDVARQLVVFMQRSGGQAQFSAQLSVRTPERDVFRELQAFIVEHPEGDLRVAALARRARMSPRNFARRFREQFGLTPARYVTEVRVEAARRQLELDDANLDRVAEHCGFGSEETMRRSFMRVLRVVPKNYRRRFAAHTTESAEAVLTAKQQALATGRAGNTRDGGGAPGKERA